VKVPSVFFGGLASGTVGFVDSTELRVRTPPHAPGNVSVTVRQDDGEFTAPNAFTYSADPYKITPSSGPLAGGTVVTITGQFGSWPYSVIFGQTFAPGYLLDNHTLVTVTPPAAGPGRVPVTIFEYDIGIPTNQTFNYLSGPADDQERILLPILTPPVTGATGRFHSELRAFNRSTSQTAHIFGLSQACFGVCPPVVPDPTRDSIEIAEQHAVSPADVVYNGTPGRFIYVSLEQVARLWLNLRVFDETRSSENFGTEIPIVRDRDLFRNEPIVFNDVPSDALFRNTLRIYATDAMTVRVEIVAGDQVTVRHVALRQGTSRFDPAYAQIGDLPSGAGPLRILITPPVAGEAGFFTPYWAFVSVTNNQTQMITTIRP
jgi:hypothetical protein